ncbi:MarR family transcriptional regulator [Oerskovia flava]|uniref:MarR family transcriptional regulator n=1 Tax=Oerskovia flava TaxID=2986422 RepID=UPI00223EBF9B|nr:MarR family transcriptional regulator [Oerskovia sp. JB1-3-2]
MHTEMLHQLDQGLRRLVQFRGLLDSSGVSAGVDASVSEALALTRLQERPLSQHELGQLLGLEKSTISRLVDGLHTKGWVSRSPAPENRRIKIVALTAAGQAAAATVEQAMLDRHRRMLDRLSAREQEALAIALPALLRSLAEDDD